MAGGAVAGDLGIIGGYATDLVGNPELVADLANQAAAVYTHLLGVAKVGLRDVMRYACGEPCDTANSRRTRHGL